MAVDSAIDHDLACIFCGYNLRSLPAAGNCPECGNGVGPTLDKFNGERSKIIIGQCNPAIVSEWIEGMTCVIASFVLVTVAMWIFEPMGQYRAFRRQMLYAACTAWVVNGFGIWKVAARDTVGDAQSASQPTTLRWCICLYTAVPAMLFFNGGFRSRRSKPCLRCSRLLRE